MDPRIAALRAPSIRAPTRLRPVRYSIMFAPAYDTALRRPLPPAYDACVKVGKRVTSLSLVRYRRNDYSVPTSFGHREVIVRGYVHSSKLRRGSMR